MAVTEIYNLPDPELSSQFGARQTAYDEAVRRGWVGAPERVAAEAASVQGAMPQYDQVDLLMETNIRSRFAEIEVMPGLDARRSISRAEAPSLGSDLKRASDQQKVETVMGTASTDEKESGQKVVDVIQTTRVHNREIRDVRARMGSVLSG